MGSPSSSAYSVLPTRPTGCQSRGAMVEGRINENSNLASALAESPDLLLVLLEQDAALRVVLELDLPIKDDVLLPLPALTHIERTPDSEADHDALASLRRASFRQRDDHGAGQKHVVNGVCAVEFGLCSGFLWRLWEDDAPLRDLELDCREDASAGRVLIDSAPSFACIGRALVRLA